MGRINPLRVFAGVLLVVGLCARVGSAGTPAEDSAMAGQKQTLPVVSDAAAAAAQAGRQVLVHGIARDAKLGAAVINEDLQVYCLALDRWSPELNGQPVRVHGRLEHTAEFAAPAGEARAGTEGPVWVLRDCRLEPR